MFGGVRTGHSVDTSAEHQEAMAKYVGRFYVEDEGNVAAWKDANPGKVRGMFRDCVDGIVILCDSNILIMTT